MVLKYRYLGYGVTNSNGKAQLTHDASGDALATPGYVGEGNGLTQIIASVDDDSHISESSLQSETYNVWDMLFYDIGTTGTLRADWYYSGGIFVSSATGLKITNNTSTGYVVAPNISGNTTNPTMNEMCLFTDGTVCEFVMVDKTATIDLQTRNINGYITHHYLTDIINPNIKLTYKDGVVSVKANNTIINTDQSQTGDVMIRIQATNGYFEFKDFKVYSI